MQSAYSPHILYMCSNITTIRITCYFWWFGYVCLRCGNRRRLQLLSFPPHPPRALGTREQETWRDFLFCCSKHGLVKWLKDRTKEFSEIDSTFSRTLFHLMFPGGSRVLKTLVEKLIFFALLFSFEKNFFAANWVFFVIRAKMSLEWQNKNCGLVLFKVFQGAVLVMGWGRGRFWWSGGEEAASEKNKLFLTYFQEVFVFKNQIAIWDTYRRAVCIPK